MSLWDGAPQLARETANTLQHQLDSIRHRPLGSFPPVLTLEGLQADCEATIIRLNTIRVAKSRPLRRLFPSDSKFNREIDVVESFSSKLIKGALWDIMVRLQPTDVGRPFTETPKRHPTNSIDEDIAEIERIIRWCVNNGATPIPEKPDGGGERSIKTLRVTKKAAAVALGFSIRTFEKRIQGQNLRLDITSDNQNAWYDWDSIAKIVPTAPSKKIAYETILRAESDKFSPAKESHVTWQFRGNLTPITAQPV